MDQENQEPQVESTSTEEIPQTKAHSTEEQARKMGWKPLEEFEGDPDKWVEANVFVARAPLFEKIEQDKKMYRKQLEELNRTVKELAEHNKKTEEAAYKRALAELKAQQKAAIAEGETERAFDIQEQIDELKESKPKAPEVPAQTGPDPEFVEWVANNAWYQTDAELREEADALGMAEAMKGTPKSKIFEKVEEKIKKMYPEKFKTVKAPPATESPQQGGKGSRKDDFRMTPAEERLMEKFISKGIITREKYIADLKAQRGK